MSPQAGGPLRERGHLTLGDSIHVGVCNMVRESGRVVQEGKRACREGGGQVARNDKCMKEGRVYASQEEVIRWLSCIWREGGDAGERVAE